VIETGALETVCRALRDPAAVDFVRVTVQSGYREVCTSQLSQVDALVDEAFDALVKSQQRRSDPAGLSAVTDLLIERTFHKSDSTFWFNAGYHEYKTVIKPETDYLQLKDMIVGSRVLDYGCGSGYLAARLARNGFEVFTTDVLDYRYELPFVQMTSPTDLAYPDDSMDTALIQAVLHHIDPANLAGALGRLAKIARFALIKEDTFDLPPGMAGLAEVSATQPLLSDFVQLPRDTQLEALILIDYYANAVAQGIPDMNMPFQFKSPTEWEHVLAGSGWTVIKRVLAGFEPGRMHKSCHIWMLCERA
jgi:SAM-dependent methyltransferase